MTEVVTSAAPGDLVGFVGLGNMGEPMARRVLGAGYRLLGFDTNRAAGHALDGLDGFSRAKAIGDVVTGTRALLMSTRWCGCTV